MRGFHTIVLVALALGLGACGARARFSIVRPAMLDASPFGNTFSVQPFTGVNAAAAYRAQSLVEQRIVQSINPAIQLLAGGGGVIVGGSVIDYSYVESTSAYRDTCYRTIYFRDPSGNRRSRQIPYGCTRFTRNGTAHSATQFTVMIAATGQVVWNRVYEDSAQRSTTGTDRQPPYIDGGAILDALLNRSVAEFARVILPWPDEVQIAFSDCGGADGCDAAWELIRSTNLEGAEAIYTRILGPYDQPTDTVAPEDVEIVAKTLFNRGIVRAYSGSYELGMNDIRRAIQLRPVERHWPEELATIETLAAEYDQLRSQFSGQ